MAEVHIPTEYRLSCSQHREYPRNLIPGVSRTYQWTLERYKNRFDDEKKRLCLIKGKDVEVPIRDVYFDLHKGNGQISFNGCG